MSLKTKLLYEGIEADSATGAIYSCLSSFSYVQEKVDKNKSYEYSRTRNPTRYILEKNLTTIENAQFGLYFGSGFAAVDTAIKILNPGDEVIFTNGFYGGSYRLFMTIFFKMWHQIQLY